MVAVRLARPADIALLASLHAACFQEPWDEQAFLRLLEHEGCFAFVANDSQSFVLVQAAADECEILSLGTKPEARRSGHARAVLVAALAEACHRGARMMFLEVAHDNEAALGLYRNAGFAVAGRRSGYYRRESSSADAVILRASLALNG